MLSSTYSAVSRTSQRPARLRPFSAVFGSPFIAFWAWANNSPETFIIMNFQSELKAACAGNVSAHDVRSPRVLEAIGGSDARDGFGSASQSADDALQFALSRALRQLPVRFALAQR